MTMVSLLKIVGKEEKILIEANYSEPMLAVRNISKKFGKHMALDQLDFLLHSGEVVGLLGPNGAGKSTLIKCIVGLLRPTNGEIRINGHMRGSRAARQTSAYVPEIHQWKDEGKTLFISTHLLDPIEAVCNRVIVLKKGKIIAQGSLEDLRHQLGDENASLEEVFLEVTADV